MTPTAFEVVHVHGLPIARLELDGLLSCFLEAAREGRKAGVRPTTIAYVNAHSCNLAARLPAFRAALLQADVLYLDGNGPRLAAWLAGHRLPARMTAADWVDRLCEIWACEGLSIYLLGAAPGVAAVAAERMRERCLELRVLGCRHGFLSPAELAEAVEEIERLRPDLLLLAMGSPAQELLMSRLRSRLSIPVIWSGGGVLDYTSGAVRRAPPWMRRVGLEWLGRMLIEPRRLVSRYALGVPLFLARSVSGALREFAGRLR